MLLSFLHKNTFEFTISEGTNGNARRCVSDSETEPSEIKAKACNALCHEAHIERREKKRCKCSSDKKAMCSIKY